MGCTEARLWGYQAPESLQLSEKTIGISVIGFNHGTNPLTGCRLWPRGPRAGPVPSSPVPV